MPWQHCKNTYNTERCISMDDIKKLCQGEGSQADIEENRLECAKLSNRTSPTEEFFK